MAGVIHMLPKKMRRKIRGTQTPKKMREHPAAAIPKIDSIAKKELKE
jgi:hypothetical protein